MRTRILAGLALVALVAAASSGVLAQSQAPLPQSPPPPEKGQDQGGFRFRAGVDLINVSATVTDASGRFVPGLHQDDFIVYEDGVPQQVTHFSAERVPVSLGLVLDTSTSMAGEKWDHAIEALDRFLLDLLQPQDEVFLYRFSNDPVLVQDWTTDRMLLSHVLDRVVPRGGTAMYDALAEAVPLADTGHNRKKAIVVISDGNDNRSQTSVPELKHMIHNSEVLIYAIGIDGEEQQQYSVGHVPPAAAHLHSVSWRTETARALAGGSRRRTRERTHSRDARRGRARERERAPRDHRRQRRTHRDHRDGPRSGSGDDGDCRRADEAVFPGVPGRREEGRPVAHHPRRGEERTVPGARAARIRRELGSR